MVRKWHKLVQNAILWKNAKVEDYAGFRLFAVKSMKFSLTWFSGKNPAIF